MTGEQRIVPRFVEEIPAEPDDGMLYVSIEYTTALHRCCCGCGAEVVTPLHPTRWSVAYDGVDISLWPSVGSWGLACRSHYVITRGRVRWARDCSDEEIAAGVRRDRASTDALFETRPGESGTAHDAVPARPERFNPLRWLTRRG